MYPVGFGFWKNLLNEQLEQGMGPGTLNVHMRMSNHSVLLALFHHFNTLLCILHLYLIQALHINPVFLILMNMHFIFLNPLKIILKQIHHGLIIEFQK